MFGQSRTTRSAGASDGQDREYREPLLGAGSDRDDVVFNADDDDDDDDDEVPLAQKYSSNTGQAQGNNGTANANGHSVRFEESVQVIAPSLRSTMSSREAGMFMSLLRKHMVYAHVLQEYELDDDVLDEQDSALRTHASQRDRNSMPLLVGLLQSSSSRDASIPLHNDGATQEEREELEALAAKKDAGGGMLDSIANMANSILGAGIIGEHEKILHT